MVLFCRSQKDIFGGITKLINLSLGQYQITKAWIRLVLEPITEHDKPFTTLFTIFSWSAIIHLVILKRKWGRPKTSWRRTAAKERKKGG